MPTKRGVAILGARAAAGLVGLAVIAAAVSAGAVVDWPTVQKTPPSAVIDPQPGQQQRVCAGPLLTLAEDSSQASAATSVGSAVSVFGARASANDTKDIRPEVTDLNAVDNADAGSDGTPQLLSVPVEPGASAAPLVAGSQSQTAAGETIAGFAASACAEAVSDSWLVGGSTDIGHTSLVLLSNPSTVLATVNLTVYSETGRIDAPGSTGILVQPGTQRIVSLAGLAPNLKSPIVHVEARGGQVAASLEQSVIHGIQPSGVEMIGPTSPAALEQTIPGVIITPPPAGSVASADDEFTDESSTVRVMVPGTEHATVQVGLISEDGTAGGTSLKVNLEPGVATEVPLDSLAPGSFTVRLTADKPIVAAARTSTAGTTGKDFAWFAASGTLTDSFMVAVADGPSPSLHLYNAGQADADLTVTDVAGVSVRLTVPSGESIIAPFAPSGRYIVTGAKHIVASVGYTGDGQLSSFPVSPAGPLATPIRVYAH
ncbi:DUF5719 family protein [Glaciibacter sp. 2TAF33]|uniref:DUF5719 family protein n=1 Tax=Glaciibacter sp. 2TAF33 TaxID=3233015 RepID=UPI003F8EF7C2